MYTDLFTDVRTNDFPSHLLSNMNLKLSTTSDQGPIQNHLHGSSGCQICLVYLLDVES